MNPNSGQVPSFPLSRQPRSHGEAHRALADWHSIRSNVIRLEREVQLAVYWVRFHTRENEPRANPDAIRHLVSTSTLSEFILRAQSIRERHVVMVQDIARIMRTNEDIHELVHSNVFVQTLVRGILNSAAAFHVINRTLHVEQYWIRVIISMTPFYLSIDYDTLSWRNMTDREDCAHLVHLD